ncbi:mannitol-1-phosphate 5-dehydrogenase [Ophiostoma piceae UAMH 11346]|uniref:Mannitol-1-phosphate 5-dehydrogenase n=1 Tax=Ophiostoma piceae (strain UAMH 11346) TaxID=1262450 RepID=S3C195_OPHP1|nr:mannitol-1-phosphate 5-dehydrogenase [Ophiostoma piceae UAMH 11346]
MPSNTSPKAVHFGAGNIGRGFVACFLHNSDYEVVFADVNDSIIDQLNETKTYHVYEVGAEGTDDSTITNYRAINSRTHEAELIQEIATADVVTCSVGPNILRFIAPVIAKGIQRRDTSVMKTPLAVIACENAINATSTLAEHIHKNIADFDADEHNALARYANSAIDRIVPAQDADAGLNVKLEKFYEWVVERTPFADHHTPAIKGINWVDHLEPYIERKLYTVNTGHATAAYHGYNRKKRTVHDALQDRHIHHHVHQALEETAELITSKHGIDRDAQEAYVRKIVSRISNPHLEDANERVGRAPLRKLSRKERFIGPAAQLAEDGKKCDYLLEAAEMAFRFQNVEGDDESFELGKIMASETPDAIVRQVCGLTENDKLFPMVVKVVERVQADSEE